MQIRILRAQDVRLALPMSEAIEGMKQAFAQFSAGQAQVPLRSRIEFEQHNGVALFMPALLERSNQLGFKFVSVYPQNALRGLPTIHSLVLAIDPETGRPLAAIEGASLTAIRTGAASGAATEFLALPESRVAAIFGSGVQARTQLEAICTVRSIARVWVYTREAAHARKFAEEMGGRGPIPEDVRIAGLPGQALAEAEVICTATSSPTPVFEGRELQAGTHINAVGSFTPSMQEVDAETVQQSLVVVDSRSAVLAEAGDLIVPIRDGIVSEDHIHAELGEIVSGQRPGRTRADQITLFKSVGLAVQDALAADQALRRAEEQGLGQVVEL